GLGVALLKDAVYRTMSIAQQVGVRALIVHALDDSVRNFYLKYAFVPSPFQSLTLLYPITLE
ncbi:GNAT family N-acetyltransferase, partial [Escherichia coli]|nr:GNAT family N-acetyltransferase [Escherichia coli]